MWSSAASLQHFVAANQGPRSTSVRGRPRGNLPEEHVWLGQGQGARELRSRISYVTCLVHLDSKVADTVRAPHDTGHLDGQELGGRSLCADSRNGSGPILVRDLLLCKPSVAKPGCSKNHPPSGGGGGPAPDGSPLYAQGGPVSYPDASILSSSTSTGSSSFSQVRSPCRLSTLLRRLTVSC